MGSYNHDEFVPEVSTGGDGRGGGDASCDMRGSRLCGEVCCSNFESRRSHCNCELCGAYGVRREVRGEGAGNLEWGFLRQSERNADMKGCDELCGVELYSLIRCQWSKRPLPT